MYRDVFVDGGSEAELPRQVLPLPAALFDEGLDLRAQGAYYTLCLIALTLTLLGVASLQRTRWGRSMIAVRDNERAAAAFGISPTRVKLMAFGIGGWIAGVAGGLLVGLVTEASPGDFLAAESLRVISIVVIGGLSSVAGAVVGAFFVIGLPKLFDDSVEIGLLTSGAGMLLLLLYFPGGLVQVFYSARDAVFAVLARRRAPEPEDHRRATRRFRRPFPSPVRPLPAGLDTVLRVHEVTVRFGARTVVDAGRLARGARARSSDSSVPTARARRR